MENTVRILIVDDDKPLADVMREILRREGCETSVAFTAQEGLRLARLNKPHLVLLDVRLPDLSGTEVCRLLRAEAVLADAVIILVSGEEIDVAHRVGGLNEGADDYMVKPIDPRELLARIRVLLRLRQTTVALRKSEQYYRRLVEILPEAVGLVDLRGRLLAANAQAAEILGYRSAADLVGRSVFEFVSREINDRLRRDLGDWIPVRSVRNLECVLIRRDGGLVHGELSVSAVDVRNGRAIRSLLVVHDISERKRSEEKIRLLADAVQSVREMISIRDGEDRVTFVNRALLKTYGYRSDEVLGQKLSLLYSRKNPAGMSEMIYRSTLAGGWEGEIVSSRKDGADFPSVLSSSPIRDHEGKLLGLVGVARDITEQRTLHRHNRAFMLLGQRLSASLTAVDAAKVIFETASELFSWDAGYVDLYARDRDRVIPVLTMDTIQGKRVVANLSSPIPTPMMRLVMAEGAKLINRPQAELGHIPFEKFGDRARMSASMMYVPIRSHEAPLGVLSLQSYTPNNYSRTDLRLLQTLADLCGGAVLRIEAGEALMRAEAKYRQIFEGATEGIFQSTPQGRYLSANPALARMLGYDSPEELMASILDLENQSYVDPARRRELKRLVESQERVRAFEVQRYRKDGSRIWVAVNAHCVRGSDGAVLYYEGTNQDITEQKHMQEALAQSQRLQTTIFDTISEPVWMKSADGRYQACNQAFAEFYLKSPADLVGRKLSEFDPAEAQTAEREEYEILRSGKPIRLQRRRTDAKGRVHWFEVSKSPLFDELKKVVAIVGIAHDLTERVRLEDELRELPGLIIEAQEAERLRVSRELHDGVNQLIASAQMRLVEVAESLGKTHVAAREILGRCRATLIQALEENRRIAHNLRPSELDQLGLTMACRQMCKQLRKRTGIVVICRISQLGTRLPPQFELHLFRILQEALNNVEQHSHAKKVQVRLLLQNDRLRLSVKDNGQGFEPRTDGGRSRKRLGAGLTSIRERAAALGGICEIESAPKQGTCITVTLDHPHCRGK